MPVPQVYVTPSLLLSSALHMLQSRQGLGRPRPYACWLAGNCSHSCGALLLTHPEIIQNQQSDCLLPSPAQSPAQQQQQLWQHWEQLTTEDIWQPDLQPTMQPVAGKPCQPTQDEPILLTAKTATLHVMQHRLQLSDGRCSPSFKPSCARAGHPDTAPVQSQPLMPPEAHQQQQQQILQQGPGVQPQLQHAAHTHWQQQELQNGQRSADLLQRAEYCQQPGGCPICLHTGVCQAPGTRSGGAQKLRAILRL